MNFVLELIIRASCSRLRLFVDHVVGDMKLDAQEKLSVLTTFSGFIGLCRVSIMYYMELLDKKLAEPEISIHLGTTLFLLFVFFLFFCDICSVRKP